MTNQRPRPDDAVLGGQTQAPLDAAVLGGIEGVRQKLASDNEAVKKAGILQALNYGRKGINILFDVLEREKSLDIQWLAYQTLERQGDSVINARLRNYYPWYEYKYATVNSQGEIIQWTPGRARYYRQYLANNGVYLDMVYVIGGSFLMGAPQSEYGSYDDEKPQHRVTVPDFWMGKYPVTQSQWEAIMGKNPARFKGANRPMERVSWDMCQEFCRKLSECIGKDYRLPSEAEWEYACRAGTTTPFSCGETITTNLANYDGSYAYAAERQGMYRKQTVEVGSLPSNPWGLYDMHGNVLEWCEDDWHENYQEVPINEIACKNNHSQDICHVLRGGSWYSEPFECRSASRHKFYSDGDYNYFGLRLALTKDST